MAKHLALEVDLQVFQPRESLGSDDLNVPVSELFEALLFFGRELLPLADSLAVFLVESRS